MAVAMQLAAAAVKVTTKQAVVMTAVIVGPLAACLAIAAIPRPFWTMIRPGSYRNERCKVFSVRYRLQGWVEVGL